MDKFYKGKGRYLFHGNQGFQRFRVFANREEYRMAYRHYKQYFGIYDVECVERLPWL